MTTSSIRDKVTQLSLRRGILFPSAEIYPLMGGFYDYGHVGNSIKRNIQNLWRSYFVSKHGFFEIDTAIILPEIVVKASGHLDHFTDPVTTCKYCGSKFRADHLLAENEIHIEGKTTDDINKLLKEKSVRCLNCAKNGFKDVSFFNLMFHVNIGPIDGVPGYLRPETAQGMFTAFQRIYKSYGKLPMGLAQLGKVFRNEISPRQGAVRLREFNQMELEYFFDPKNPTFPEFKQMENRKLRFLTQEDQEKKKEAKMITCNDALTKKYVPNEITAYFMGLTIDFFEACGIPLDKMHFRHLLKDETPHYSGGNYDLEVDTSYGALEIVSLAFRTDYDLKSHMQASEKELTVFLPDGRRVIPNVVEPSFGLDRLLWAVLEHSYRDKDKLHDWEWLDLPRTLAPYDVAIFPLMKKDGMGDKAKEITQDLRGSRFEVLYNESGSIGRRYAKADEIGIKWAITVDYDTLKDKTVTLRDRNTTKQVRIPISKLAEKISE